jgi:hypothetical protein
VYAVAATTGDVVAVAIGFCVGIVVKDAVFFEHIEIGFAWSVRIGGDGGDNGDTKD